MVFERCQPWEGGEEGVRELFIIDIRVRHLRNVCENVSCFTKIRYSLFYLYYELTFCFMFGFLSIENRCWWLLVLLMFSSALCL